MWTLQLSMWMVLFVYDPGIFIRIATPRVDAIVHVDARPRTPRGLAGSESARFRNSVSRNREGSLDSDSSTPSTRISSTPPLTRISSTH